MTNFGALFDSYGRKARLYPALLTLLPPLAAVLGWAREWPSVPVAAAITIAASFGLLYALATVARSSGKRVEKRLLVQWEGWPTTTLLRHRDPRLSAATKARYHSFLNTSVGSMPTMKQENAKPYEADEKYASAILWLKEQRRGPGFQLVHRENAEYGFRRNLRGLRSAGILLCLTALAGWSFALLSQIDLSSIKQSDHPLRAIWIAAPPTAWAALGFVALALVCWIVVVRDRWVTEASETYAAALLATCDAPR